MVAELLVSKLPIDILKQIEPYLVNFKDDSNLTLEKAKWIKKYRPYHLFSDYSCECAAQKGDIDLLLWLYGNGNIPTGFAIDLASSSGHLEIIKWLHFINLKGSEWSTYFAVRDCHFEVVKWLYSQGYVISDDNYEFDYLYMDICFNLDILKFLHYELGLGCSTLLMDTAAGRGRLDIITWLYDNKDSLGFEDDELMCTSNAMDFAAKNGHLEVIQFLHEFQDAGCTYIAMDIAAENGHFEIVKWLFDFRIEEGTMNGLDMAARNGHYNIVVFLAENYDGIKYNTFRYFETEYNEEYSNAHYLALVNGHMDIVHYFEN
jgi:hypothetical protein